MQQDKVGPQGERGLYVDFPRGENKVKAIGPQGENMDVHNLPKAYDVMLQDLTTKDLHAEVASQLQLSYLAEAQATLINNETQGIFWGRFDRPILAYHVRSAENEPRIVFFLVDTGSPFTFLCGEALRALGETNIIDRAYAVKINGRSWTASLSPPDKHFADVNVLGMDYLRNFKAVVTLDLSRSAVTVVLQE